PYTTLFRSFVNTMTKAHQAYARILVLDLFHELANLGDAAIGLEFFEHLQASFVGTAVSRAPQATNTGSDCCKWVGTRRTAQAYSGSRCILLVICMQNEDAIQRFFNNRIDLVVFAWRSKHRSEE